MKLGLDAVLDDRGKVLDQGLEAVDRKAVGGPQGSGFGLGARGGYGWRHDRSPQSLSRLRIVIVEEHGGGGNLISITQVSLVQGSDGYWWGTFSFGDTNSNCDCNIGRIRVFQSSTNARGYVVQILNTDNTWQTVGDDGHFTFLPANQNLRYAMRRVSLLAKSDGSYEAWGDAFGAEEAINPANPGCTAMPYQNTSSTLLYASITENGPLNIDTSIGYRSGVSVRAIPDTNPYGRNYPYVIYDMLGKKLIYSSSTDRWVCQHGSDSNFVDPGFKTSEIVLTVLDQ